MNNEMILVDIPSDIKVFHTITCINRGGAENHLVDLVKEQVHKNCQVTVAYLKGDAYWHQTLTSLGVRVVHLKLRHYGDIRPAIKLRSLIHEFQPDIIHAHLPPAELYTRIALLGIFSNNLPFIISKHNDQPFYQGIGQRLIGGWVARRAKHLIAISNAVNKNTCIKNLGYSPNKVATIYYGIDTVPYEKVQAEAIQAVRSAWFVTDDTYLIGTVARLVPQKALHILLEGFSLYLKMATKPVKLVLVGAGVLEADLKILATQLGIQNYVIWAGFREDIHAVMNALDVFTLTSVYEGLGLVLLEAMSAGKPVIATNVSAIPEVVKNEVTGILVPPQDPMSLAKGFQFFEDNEIRIKFGIAGRKLVKESFTLNCMIEQTLSLYNQCLKEM